MVFTVWLPNPGMVPTEIEGELAGTTVTFTLSKNVVWLAIVDPCQYVPRYDMEVPV